MPTSPTRCLPSNQNTETGIRGIWWHSRSITAEGHRIRHTVAIGLATRPVRLGRFSRALMQAAPFAPCVWTEVVSSKAGSGWVLTGLQPWLVKIDFGYNISLSSRDESHERPICLGVPSRARNIPGGVGINIYDYIAILARTSQRGIFPPLPQPQLYRLPSLERHTRVEAQNMYPAVENPGRLAAELRECRSRLPHGRSRNKQGLCLAPQCKSAKGRRSWPARMHFDRTLSYGQARRCDVMQCNATSEKNLKGR